MRTVGDILDSVKDGEEPSFEEMKFCLLAIEALRYFDNRSLKHLYDICNPTFHDVKVKYEDSNNRLFECLRTDAKKYIGEDNDPANKGYQKQRKNIKHLVDKLL